MSDVQGWHKRHAISLASQLPEAPEDAEIILRLALDLVDSFLRDDPKPVAPEREGVILLLTRPR